MATFVKQRTCDKSACLTDWNKIITQDCNQDKRQTNSTPDSSSGVISDYHGVTTSEVSESSKTNTTSFHHKGPQCKKPFRRNNDQFSPEKHLGASIYQNMCEINKVLEPIEEQLAQMNTAKLKEEKKVGGRMKRQVKSLFQPALLHNFHKGCRSESGSTGSATNDTIKEACYFDSLTDSVITHIFTYLLSNQLCKCAMVCKRWYQLVWNPRLWSCIDIHSHKLDADAAIRSLSRALSIDHSRACLIVQVIDLSHCLRLTDRGVFTIAKRCLELKELVLNACVEVSNISIFEVVSRCTNLQVLSVAGCPYVTCISLTPEANLQATAYGKQVFLSHLDMSDCTNVDDSSLHIIATYLCNLMHLYLRRCFKISDLGVQYVATYCPKLRELSVSDCTKISDLGLRDISRLGSSLKYLSIAKCRKVTDAGLKCLAVSCTKIRYLNIRGCGRVSEEGLIFVSSVCSKLKSLDVGACLDAVTDRSLVALSFNCKHLRRLSIRECKGVTDQGIKDFAVAAGHLQQFNLIDCSLTSSSLKVFRQHCSECIIECNEDTFCN